jgi:hypothetical protein
MADTLKGHLEQINRVLYDCKGDLLFDEKVENLDKGFTADNIILALASIEQAMGFLRIAIRHNDKGE